MPFKKILACVDFSQGVTEIVSETAAELTHQSNATLYLMHVVEREVPALLSEGIIIPKLELEKFEEMYKMLEEKAKDKLEVLQKDLRQKWEIEIFPVVQIGEPSELILDEAEEKGIDLIVVGSHGKRGIEKLLLGSVSEKVARKTKCSVLVVRME